MAETDVFYCETRDKTGTGNARAARRDGWVPAVLYGGDLDPVAVALRENEVKKAYVNGRLLAHLAKIDVPGEDGQQPVIARDVQVHPVKGHLVHVDLMRVNEKTRIDVAVPVRFINEESSPGLKKGGVLNVVRHDVEVYAPATAIPEVFEIDVSGLEIGDGIHASTINLPQGVTFVITDRDFTIATIAAPSALRSSEDEGEEAEGEAEGEEESKDEGEKEE
ncbi:50S ribosomal protein L25/general stress protein Ctc [Hyphococcus luteus]|uniref:Large ribosomal subunit protein bL25 n=1 Tax=Hyphococcus luteus TaxID=2058213 RepID=A0A2S7K2R8_9PROT|nr:50S ribosomal protein L25/general stress protein Ctc [Marinicaulis flavus]PQA86781.1 50S ribosomal protein L25 [Marinicaulis flavus]